MDCTQHCCLKKHGDYLVSSFSSEDLETLKEIIKLKCANPFRVLDSNGRSIFHIVASLGRTNILEWLCSELKSFNVLQTKDKESGYTALHRALYYGNIDCAVMLYKILGDWRSHDVQGNTPLDLVMLDSPRYNKKKEKIAMLAVAVLPFESGGEGELSFHSGDLLEIIDVNPNGWSFGKLIGNQQKGLFPSNFVERTQPDKVFQGSFETQLNVFTWGNNTNFNLGHADSRNRIHPEQVPILVDIIDVSITKFHAVFLSKSGQIFTCGHGLNGRLGHNSEETIIRPKLVEDLKNVRCIIIKAADYHTVVLDEMRQVYTFGSNQYCQLGHIPKPNNLLYPKQINCKSFRNKEIIGIAAACFHTAVYTSHELYTFGLNAGQLGHSKDEKYQCSPKLVSYLYNKDTEILQVLASDGATLCLMMNGDLYLMQNYVCRKISVKMTDVQSLQMIGGVLDGESSKIENPLQICVLYSSGVLEYWSSQFPSFRKCYWSGEKLINTKIVDIALGHHLLLVTNYGKVYQGHFKNELNKDSFLTPVNTAKIATLSSLSNIVEKYKEQKRQLVYIHMERVPLLFQAMKCICDSKSKSFATIQNDPRIGLTSFPSVSDSMLSDDLEKIISQASIMDELHDLLIKTDSCVIPCHSFVLQCAGIPLDRLITLNDKPCMDYSHISYTATKYWIRQLYRGNSVEKIPSESQVSQMCIVNEHPNDHSKDDNFNIHDDMISILTAELEPFEIEENVHKKIQKQQHCEKKQKSSKKKLNQSLKNIEKINNSKRQSAEKRYYSHRNLANWQKLKNLSDVTINCCDGGSFECHKCVLVVRSDYFQNMLSNEWLESSYINMNIPSSILSPIINFLYTDEPWISAPDDINYVGEVMACADHLLLSRLKQICELDLAKKVTLKNAPDIFQFACTFSSNSLKEFSAEFISLNLPYYLEARLLEDIEYDYLKELSIIYKRLVNGMEERIIKPSQLHCLIEVKDEALQNSLIPKLNKTFQMNNNLHNMKSFNNTGEDLKNEANSIPEKPVLMSSTKTGFENYSMTSEINNLGNICQVPNEVKHKFSPFKKKSQRERKKGSLNNEEAVLPVAVQEKDTMCPWATNLTNQSVSFRELLHEESVPENKRLPSPFKKFPSSKINKRLSFDEKPKRSSGIENLSSERSPWGDISVNSDASTEVRMVHLLKEEEKQQAFEMFQKPVTLIQTEERAMEELLNYYEKMHPGDEIKVKRLDRALSTPYWNRESSPKKTL